MTIHSDFYSDLRARPGAIENARRRQGVRRRHLAAAFGLSDEELAAIESGEPCDPFLGDRLCKALGVGGLFEKASR